MKKLLLFPILFLSIQVLIAQPEDKKLGKITFLMVDGEYEDAADKAEEALSSLDSHNDFITFSSDTFQAAQPVAFYGGAGQDTISFW